MSKINKFLLAGDKFMPQMHLRLFIVLGKEQRKNKEQIQKFKETGDLKMYL